MPQILKNLKKFQKIILKIISNQISTEWAKQILGNWLNFLFGTYDGLCKQLFDATNTQKSQKKNQKIIEKIKPDQINPG